tara:strand:+ start:2217 stop:4262 length:2046 start_codon:yes stop_codon:yes gene_type:complete
MKLKLPLIFFLFNTFIAYSQCTINDATDCQCLDPSQTDCDLLPDIQVSWVGLESVADGASEYAQNGEGENNGRLRISVSTPNTGHGPLTVRGAGPDGYRTFICGSDTTQIYDPNSNIEYTCDNGLEPQQIIWQRIYHRNADGSMSYYDREAGTMTYHPTHGHNHTNDWGVFTLRIKDDNEPDPRNWPIVSDGAKLGFCLMDYNICSPDPSIPTPYNNQLAPEDYTGHCRDDNTVYGEGEVLYNVDFPNFGLGGGEYGCSEVEQGISSGWLDLYGEWLDEQWINLDPNLCNGDYWIVGIADPNDYYLEENDDNNYSAIPVTLSLQNENSTSTINVTGDVQICEGEDIELTANYGDSYLWSTGETTQSIMVSEPGNYSVTVQNSNCSFIFGSPETNVSEVIVDAPSIENPISTSCIGEALSIELNVENANWYNEDQELVYTGNPYYMPVLEEDVHLFASQIAQDLSSDYVGQATHEGTNSYSGDQYNSYLIFNANSDFTLNSLDVFTDSQYAGNRTIELRTEIDQVLLDTTIYIGGDATIQLDWDIPEGLNYRLGTNTNMNYSNFGYENPMLKRSNNNTPSYPYTIENVVNITDSEYGNEYYYYFYNWQISWFNSSCESEDLLEINIDAIECHTSIEEVNSEEDILIGIFDLVGRKMHNELNELPFGVYIMKYEGKSVKIIKH